MAEDGRVALVEKAYYYLAEKRSSQLTKNNKALYEYTKCLASFPGSPEQLQYHVPEQGSLGTRLLSAII